jgi:hypothetical protein
MAVFTRTADGGRARAQSEPNAAAEPGRSGRPDTQGTPGAQDSTYTTETSGKEAVA